MADSVNTTSIETILQLRHDDKSNWETDAGKATPLKPGEAAVEISEKGKVKLKIGTKDTDTFETAPYVGGEDAQVFQSENIAGTDTRDDITIIEATISDDVEIHDGDIAIVKRYLNGTSGALTYTSYVYDSKVTGDVKWIAMDGNYSASNVFFKDNITITQTVGNVTTSNGAPKEIPCKGKNINQLFELLYASEDCKGTKISSNPSVTWTVTGAVNGEVGTTFTRPTGTIKVSSLGAYTYKCKDSSGNVYSSGETGVTFNTLKVAGSVTKADVDTRAEVIAATTNCNSNTTGGLVKDAAISYTASETEIPSVQFTETVKYYYFGASADSTASARKPITNLGNFVVSDTESSTEYADGIRAITARTYGEGANQDLNTTTWSATGWRGWFQGYKAKGSELTVSSLTSAQVRALSAAKNGAFTKSTANVPVGTNQLLYACPKGKITYTLQDDGVTVKSGFTASQSTPATPLTVKHTTASVEGANGYTAIEYDVFYCENVDFIDKQTVTIAY